MRSITFALLPFLFLTVLMGCNKEKSICSEELTGETYLLSDTTTAYVSNYLNAGNIIFKDLSTDEEVAFAVEDFKDTLLYYTRSVTCEENPDLSRAVKGQSQWIQVVLSNTDLGEDLIIRLTQFPFDTVSEEEMALFYGQIENTTLDYSEARGLLAHGPRRELPVFSFIRDSLLIGDTFFYGVIEPDPDNPGFPLPFDPPIEVKYTATEGIVYLNDKINNRELAYQRVE